MHIDIPELSVVLLIGPPEKRRRDFAQRFFKYEEVLKRSDFEESVFNSNYVDGIELLYEKVSKRLRDAEMTVIDTEVLGPDMARRMMSLAKKYHCTLVGIVFGVPFLTQEEENMSLEDFNQMMQNQGIKRIYRIDSQIELEEVILERIRLKNNKKDVHGPFDIIGDVHGCYDELCQLLIELGYQVDKENYTAYPPVGRKAVFVGDLVDRGPKINEVLKLVMAMIEKEDAYCVLGNHDGKLQRKLRGANVQIVHGLEKSVEQLEREPEEFKERVKRFLDELVSHYVFDEGKLVVVHAGLKEKLHGRESSRVRDLAMFGETTGEKDEYGLPIRYKWSEDYRGKALVVYGHTPQVCAQMVNSTINIDTGCVFGGKLTAFRYPEKELVEVKAEAKYYEPSRPLEREQNCNESFEDEST